MPYSDLKPTWLAQVTAPTPGFDLTQPIKRWIDTRATDASNVSQSFTYTILVNNAQGVTEKDTLMLSREQAAKANVPAPGDMPRQGTPDFAKLPKPAEYPLPIRELLPGEDAKLSPFNEYNLIHPTVLPVTNEELKGLLLQILDELRKKKK